MGIKEVAKILDGVATRLIEEAEVKSGEEQTDYMMASMLVNGQMIQVKMAEMNNDKNK